MALTAFLRESELLLVLDNFEQVVAAAPLLTDLLGACARLKVLVTSRSVLGVYGEWDFAVPPLALPDPAATHSPADLAAVEAIHLFVQRAQAIKADFVLSADNAAAVVGICRQMDGLPLAIELAASRSLLFPPEALLERLKYCLPELTCGPRDQPARLRTMRDAIAWSYDLLTPPEQAVFRCLTTFIGGCTLEAAEAVCGGIEALRGSGIEAVVESLVRQSLLQVDTRSSVTGSAGPPRLTMLETVREFGLELLAARGELDQARRAHAAYFTTFGERHELGELLPDGERVLVALEAERANLWAALAWLEQAGEAEPLLRLAAALGRFWAGQGHYREGRSWLERALAGAAATPVSMRAKALVMLGKIAFFQGEQEVAETHLAEGLTLSREQGDSLLAAEALIGLGAAALVQADSALATARLEEALALSEEAPDRRLAAILAARALGNLSVVERTRGDHAMAAAHLEEALSRERVAGHTGGMIVSLGDLGDVARERGDHARALACYHEALGLCRGSLDTRSVHELLAGVAIVAAAVGQPEHAARLFGATASLRERIGLGVQVPADRVVHERALTAVRLVLGEAAFATTWAAGRELPRDQAIAEAMAVKPPVARGTAPGGVALSAREREVLALLVAGKTDREIAQALFIGRRTAESHVARLLAKLGVSTRTAAASVAVASGLVSPDTAVHRSETQ